MEVAVKKYISDDKESKKEIEELFKAACPVVVTPFGIRKCKEGKEHMVMEFARYGSFDKIIHTEKNIDFNWRVIKDVSRGSTYLHTMIYVVHRDIKPGNVLIFSKKQEDLLLLNFLILEQLKCYKQQHK